MTANIDETATRTVMGTVESVRTIEGGGFAVRRPFPTEHLAMFDPFLLLDEMGPSDYAPGEAVGALAKLVSDFLTYARPTDPIMETISVPALLNDVCGFLHAEATSTGVHLRVTAEIPDGTDR